MAILVNQVTDGYFTATGVAVIAGRAIEATDRADATPLAMVNESFVQRYSHTRNPIGRRIRLNDRELTIVGVARDGKYHYRDLDNESPPFIYTALQQGRSYSPVLHVRSTANPYALFGTIRNVLGNVDPNLTPLSPTKLDEHTAVGLFPVRLGTTVFGSLGALALLLAALGLYAVISHSVRQRHREIGIRMALGASSRRIVMAIAKDSWRFVAIGTASGLLVAAGSARVLARALPNIDAGDVAPFAVALTLLLFVAGLSTVLPAWRAIALDPANALKAD